MTPVDEIVVPASIANLGCGFDTLGLAVQLYLRARVVDSGRDGGGRVIVRHSQPPVTGENLVVRAFAEAVRRTGRSVPSVTVEVDSDIPLASGLGSSAAATVAGLRLFERVAGPLEVAALLDLAAAVEGHADNAAAALLGGLTSVVEREGQAPLAIQWRWPEGLRLVVATPSAELATRRARAIVKEQIPRQDAVFNLQRVLALVHALDAGDDQGLREAMRDRWHQRDRAMLVPQLDAMLRLEDSRVLGVCLSGAGPSIAIVVRQDAEPVAMLVTDAYERAGCPVTVRTLDVHQPLPEARPEMIAVRGGAV